ncbi:Cupin domain-containing protein [Micromonospora rhizosphaerae]|uniref:Cupin domain-containing protein n=1 Tax=Micromonospora rhizosphaerae TaxID=568872 RepID=A0A1C6SXP7_9ACTN|nr:cupin domain-containing protein [Micromonospora rhizosphaerae]SCL34331.1 Cupin domain-containing protein [Micromonospora rhizosphaerae]
MSDGPTPVVRRDQGREFLALGAPVYRLVHPKTVGSVGVGVSLCVMQPGQEVRRHRHDYEEAYYVVRGTGLMYLEDHEPIRLEPGLSVYIAANRVHGQVNDGSETLEIVCSLSPPPIEGQVPEFVEEDQ